MNKHPFDRISFRYLILGLLVVCLVVFVFWVYVMPAMGISPHFDVVIWSTVFCLQFYALYWVISQMHKSGVSVPGMVKPPHFDRRRGDVLVYVLPIALLMSSSAFLGQRIFEPLTSPLVDAWFPGIHLNAQEQAVSLSRFGKPSFWAEIFSAVILAPVIEELIFRGILMHRWGVRWNTQKALLWSSVAFAMFHSPLMWGGAFVFGLFVGFLYLESETLRIPILFHGVVNLLLLFYTPGFLGIKRMVFHGGVLVISLAVMVHFFSKHRHIFRVLLPRLETR